MKLQIRVVVTAPALPSGSNLQAAEFTADANSILIVGESKVGVFIDAQSGTLITKLKLRHDVTSCAIATGDKLAVCSSNSGSVVELSTGKVLAKAGKFKAMVRSNAFSPDGLLWMAFCDKLQIHDPQSEWKPRYRVKPPSAQDYPQTAAWLSDAEVLTSYWTMDLATRAQSSQLIAMSLDGKKRREVYKGDMLTWALSPDRTQIFGRQNDSALLLSAETGDSVQTFGVLDVASIPRSVSFFGGNRVVTLESGNGLDPFLMVWDLETGGHEVIGIDRQEIGYVVSMATHESGSIVLLTKGATAVIATLS